MVVQNFKYPKFNDGKIAVSGLGVFFLVVQRFRFPVVPVNLKAAISVVIRRNGKFNLKLRDFYPLSSRQALEICLYLL